MTRRRYQSYILLGLGRLLPWLTRWRESAGEQEGEERPWMESVSLFSLFLSSSCILYLFVVVVLLVVVKCDVQCECDKKLTKKIRSSWRHKEA